MEITIGVILLATAILNIILFFKIWIMTNDTEKIREFLEIIVSIKEHDYKNKTTKNNKDIDKNDIELYSWVIEIKSRKEFQVIEILDKNGKEVESSELLIRHYLVQQLGANQAFKINIEIKDAEPILTDQHGNQIPNDFIKTILEK